MRKTLFIISILFFPLALIAQSPEEITFEWLAQEIEENEALLVLDVRTEREYNSGHIPGAKLLPYDQIGEVLPGEDKKQPIVVYCRSGNRSAIAKASLERLGYTNVVDFGGLYRWKGPIER